MKRKLIAGLTAISMLCAGIAVPAADTAMITAHADTVMITEGDDYVKAEIIVKDHLIYYVTSDHAMFAGVDKDCPSEIVIAGSIKGVPVTTFYETPFLESSVTVTSVTLPEGFKVLDYGAFLNCTKLQSVTLPKSLEFVDTSAFWCSLGYYCPVVADKIKAGDKVIIIDGVLVTTNLTETDEDAIVLPDGVRMIASQALNKLRSVTIPASTERICENAYRQSRNDLMLNEVTILNPNCFIDDYAFCNNGGSNTAKSKYSRSTILDGAFKGIIKGYDGSTAQAYAEKNGCTFESLGAAPEQPAEPQLLPGDVDGSGAVDVTDVILLTKYLHNIGTLKAPEAADLNGDGAIDVFDLGLLKHLLLSK